MTISFGLVFRYTIVYSISAILDIIACKHEIYFYISDTMTTRRI